MKIFIEKNYTDLSKRVADIIESEMKEKSNLVLGLATGSTPVGTYEELIKRYKEEGLDFSKITTFNLDEYLGIPHDHVNSYHYFMEENFFKSINIDNDKINIPNGNPENVEEYCKAYDKKIENQGGIDIQILGIGENGHIAFNEPDDKLYLGTHVTDLTESTIKANSRFFDSIDDVPKKAITMGLGSIMKSKKILLLASGKNKANTIKKLLKDGVVSTHNPASLLLLHPDVTIILDEEAAEEYMK